MFASNVASGQPSVLGYATNVSSSALVSLTNSARSNAGLPALTTNAKLIQAANAKAQDMMAKDYWAHTSPSGKQPWDFVLEAGYDYVHAGENLAYGFSTSSAVHNGWMGSSGHRANILSSNYKEVGIAVVDAADFQGDENTIIVAMYGARSTPAPPPAPEPEPEPTPAPQPAPVESTPEPEPVVEEPEPEVEQEPEEVEEESEPSQDESEVDDESDGVAATQSSDDGNEEALPAQTSYSLLNPLGVGSLSIATAIGTATSGMMFMSSSLRHPHFWKHHRPKSLLHWLKKHPVLESVVLGAITLALFSSGFGVVG